MREFKILRINLIKYPDGRLLRVVIYHCDECNDKKLTNAGFTDEGLEENIKKLKLCTGCNKEFILTL